LSTFNLLEACSEAEKDIHFVHLGSMGVYGYFSRDTVVPEGYMDVQETEDCPGGNGNGNGTAKGSETDMSKFLCQGHPGSIYHATKMQDAILFQFYNINNGLRVTDLHQGVVWGTYTDETRQHESLVNRFDYDGDYGTFINRFLMQAAIGHPITLYGKGGQCRPIIHIKDSMRCVELALTHPPKQNDRVHIYNQTTETYQIRDIAKLVASKTGAEIKHIKNPRVENEDVKYQVDNRTLLNLGLEPTIISDNLMEEVLDVVKRYQHRCDKAVILPRSTWRKDVEIENQPLVDENERPLPVINPTRDAKDDKSAAVH
jgi:UDP-sulfoquinovose synthase